MMKEQNSIVKKSNDLIEKARFKLTPTQNRLILYAIALINTSDEDFKRYDIPISEFIEITKSSTSLYHELKKEVNKLLKKPFFIKNDDGGWIAMNWFSSVEYMPGSGILQVEFSPKLKPYLLQLKERFTVYTLQYVLPMRSFYSVRIYELLKQRQDMRKRYFDLEEFKVIMMIDDKPSFKEYGHVKDRILSIAFKEINEFSDLEITDFEEKKVSRKVVGFTIYFKLKDNFAQEGVFKFTPEIERRLESLLSHIPEEYRTSGIKDLIYDFLDRDDDYIISNIEYALDHSDDNFIGYLKKALDNDYAKDLRERQQHIKERELAEAKKKAEQRLLEEKERAVMNWWYSRVNEEFMKMSVDEMKSLRQEAIKEIKSQTPSIPEDKIPSVLIDVKMREIIRRQLESQGVEPPEDLKNY